MKILLIHSHYQLQGGEDAVVEQELELLLQDHIVEILRFQNQRGWKGALQFMSSIWNIGAANTIKKKINEFNPDVVHIHNWHFAIGPLVFRTLKKLDIPMVHTVHNYRLLCPSGILLHQGKLFTESLHQSFPWKAIFNKVYRSSIVLTFWLAFVVWFHKKIDTWKKINSYICLSPFAVNIFEQSNFGIPKKQFTVKPNFTADSDELNTDKRENHFLFIGRLSEEKGIEILLEAFKGMAFELKIAGEGPLKQMVLNVVKQYSNIIYLDKLTNEQVSVELQKTQALILPSVCYEGMPMTILEAFSTSTPVISSKIGILTDLITDDYNGFHFKAGDSSDLAKKVNYFITNKDDLQHLYANARQTYLDNYTPIINYNFLNGIYNNVIQQKKSNE